mgnify:CR=1 FL=1
MFLLAVTDIYRGETSPLLSLAAPPSAGSVSPWSQSPLDSVIALYVQQRAHARALRGAGVTVTKRHRLGSVSVGIATAGGGLSADSDSDPDLDAGADSGVQTRKTIPLRDLLLQLGVYHRFKSFGSSKNASGQMPECRRRRWLITLVGLSDGAGASNSDGVAASGAGAAASSGVGTGPGMATGADGAVAAVAAAARAGAGAIVPTVAVYSATAAASVSVAAAAAAAPVRPHVAGDLASVRKTLPRICTVCAILARDGVQADSTADVAAAAAGTHLTIVDSNGQTAHVSDDPYSEFAFTRDLIFLPLHRRFIARALLSSYVAPEFTGPSSVLATVARLQSAGRSPHCTRCGGPTVTPPQSPRTGGGATDVGVRLWALHPRLVDATCGWIGDRASAPSSAAANDDARTRAHALGELVRARERWQRRVRGIATAHDEAVDRAIALERAAAERMVAAEERCKLVAEAAVIAAKDSVIAATQVLASVPAASSVKRGGSWSDALGARPGAHRPHTAHVTRRNPSVYVTASTAPSLAAEVEDVSGNGESVLVAVAGRRLGSAMARIDLSESYGLGDSSVDTAPNGTFQRKDEASSTLTRETTEPTLLNNAASDASNTVSASRFSRPRTAYALGSYAAPLKQSAPAPTKQSNADSAATITERKPVTTTVAGTVAARARADARVAVAARATLSAYTALLLPLPQAGTSFMRRRHD